MDELTKRVRFLVNGVDKDTNEIYPAGTEMELTRTQNDFDTLVEQGVIELLDSEE
jgi:hypothetical protein